MMGIDPITHRRHTDLDILSNLSNLFTAVNGLNLANITNQLEDALRLQADAAQIARMQRINNLIQAISPDPFSTNLDALSSILGYDVHRTDLVSGPCQPNFSNSGTSILTPFLQSIILHFDGIYIEQICCLET
jgi:hypothetical protein